MDYFILFLEGILTFLSPCILPMIPLYLAYFTSDTDSKSTLKHAIQFVIGFTIIFVAMSLFVSTIGRFVLVNRQIIQYITGGVLILFGLDQWFEHRISSKVFRRSANNKESAPLHPLLFGGLFAMSWTPCVGVYLASAMALAMNGDHLVESGLLMTTYSIGLGLPFILSALFINESKQLLLKIRPHLATIQKISAILLIIFGILIATGFIYRIIPTY